MKNRTAEDPPKEIALKNKTFGFFATSPNIEEATKNSCHPVLKLPRIKKNKTTVLEFFKLNRENSYMSYLEAGAWQIASFLAPDVLPLKVKAIVNDAGAYIGVSSQAIPMKSSHEDPLTAEDLEIPVFQHLRMPCEEDQLSWEMIAEPFNDEICQLINHCEKIENWVLAHPERIKDLRDEELIPYPYENNDTKLSILDFKRFHIVKRQAEIWTGIYARKDNDPHANNAGKEFNIDFDEAYWPFFSNLKDSFCMIDGEYKKPSATAFCYTSDDVTTFPNTKTFNPHHFCTKKAGKTHSKNAFTEEQNSVYAKLEHHPVFIYYKCVYLLKYALLNREIIQALLSLHIPENDIFKEANFQFCDKLRAGPYFNKHVLDTFTNEVMNCVSEMQAVLVINSQFKTFLKKCGLNELNKWRDLLALRNKTLEAKIKKIDTQINDVLQTQAQTTLFLNFSRILGSILTNWSPSNNLDLVEKLGKKKTAYENLLIDLREMQKRFDLLNKGLLTSSRIHKLKNIKIFDEYEGQQAEQRSQQTSFRPK